MRRYPRRKNLHTSSPGHELQSSRSCQSDSSFRIHWLQLQRRPLRSWFLERGSEQLFWSSKDSKQNVLAGSNDVIIHRPHPYKTNERLKYFKKMEYFPFGTRRTAPVSS